MRVLRGLSCRQSGRSGLWRNDHNAGGWRDMGVRLHRFHALDTYFQREETSLLFAAWHSLRAVARPQWSPLAVCRNREYLAFTWSQAFARCIGVP